MTVSHVRATDGLGCGHRLDGIARVQPTRWLFDEHSAHNEIIDAAKYRSLRAFFERQIGTKALIRGGRFDSIIIHASPGWEPSRNGVSVRTELAEGLPIVEADLAASLE